MAAKNREADGERIMVPAQERTPPKKVPQRIRTLVPESSRVEEMIIHSAVSRSTAEPCNFRAGGLRFLGVPVRSHAHSPTLPILDSW